MSRSRKPRPHPGNSTSGTLLALNQARKKTLKRPRGNLPLPPRPASSLWTAQPAYTEIFLPAQAILTHLKSSNTSIPPSILKTTLSNITAHLKPPRSSCTTTTRWPSRPQSSSSWSPSTQTSTTIRTVSALRQAGCAWSSSMRRSA